MARSCFLQSSSAETRCVFPAGHSARGLSPGAGSEDFSAPASSEGSSVTWKHNRRSRKCRGDGGVAPRGNLAWRWKWHSAPKRLTALLGQSSNQSLHAGGIASATQCLFLHQRVWKVVPNRLVLRGWFLLPSIDFYQALLLVNFSLVEGTSGISDGAPAATPSRSSHLRLHPLPHKGGFVPGYRHAVFGWLWASLEGGSGLCLRAEPGRHR